MRTFSIPLRIFLFEKEENSILTSLFFPLAVFGQSDVGVGRGGEEETLEVVATRFIVQGWYSGMKESGG